MIVRYIAIYRVEEGHIAEAWPKVDVHRVCAGGK